MAPLHLPMFFDVLPHSSDRCKNLDAAPLQNNIFPYQSRVDAILYHYDPIYTICIPLQNVNETSHSGIENGGRHGGQCIAFVNSFFLSTTILSISLQQRYNPVYAVQFPPDAVLDFGHVKTYSDLSHLPHPMSFQHLNLNTQEWQRYNGGIND